MASPERERRQLVRSPPAPERGTPNGPVRRSDTHVSTHERRSNPAPPPERRSPKTPPNPTTADSMATTTKIATPTEASRQRRNRSRQDHADEADLSTIGESSGEKEGSRQRGSGESGTGEREERRVHREHLDDRASTFFGRPIRGPDDTFVPPAWFLTALQDVANEVAPTPEAPPIQFENTAEAARANAELLESVGFDIERLVRKFAKSTLGYGSEFRSVAQLEPLIGRHPHFRNLSRVLEFGMDYVFSRELDLATKSEELQTILARGNHKSAQEFSEQVTVLLTKDVTHGFSVPLPTETVGRIPTQRGHPTPGYRQAVDGRRGG